LFSSHVEFISASNYWSNGNQSFIMFTKPFKTVKLVI